ncbi:hypothetical protein GUITHDRAFT_156294 [Guillardia theta CCMP2712]|uniref:Uncharacterized protein n=1 Tax=Guillardia theta (strain CCMP2712) TaxID=905079 RepID=L1I8K2_GUITC|nr:hypothetical protein GUITHDRAFT_156294 [Guillardia theta CCMP2712]EKX32558.1 hypothetical protein GUITHDRAFT_156294 [Guillardia theta CCMP2712]|eukprot:XP_005819538.1 hypothetical protein GUITHDRAFT_156294 [Guillardia theta CCMP2712]
MDSVYGAAHRNAALMDIIDAAWAADQLSDDDVDLPNLDTNDESDDLNDQEQDDDKWNEMGLPEFQNDVI